jgi:tetratricopeptide (TPR) repeat protein
MDTHKAESNPNPFEFNTVGASDSPKPSEGANRAAGTDAYVRWFLRPKVVVPLFTGLVVVCVLLGRFIFFPAQPEATKSAQERNERTDKDKRVDERMDKEKRLKERKAKEWWERADKELNEMLKGIGEDEETNENVDDIIREREELKVWREWKEKYNAVKDEATKEQMRMEWLEWNKKYRAAEKATKEQMLKDRAAKVNQAIKANPKDADDFIKRGIANRDNLELDKAIADFGEAIKIDPMNMEAWFYRGATYSIRGFTNYDMQDYDKAISDCTELINMMKLDVKKAEMLERRD